MNIINKKKNNRDLQKSFIYLGDFMKVRCLIENKETPFLNYEHGLSLLIELNNKNILFDTGKTNSKGTESSPFLAIITLRVNGLNIQSKDRDWQNG